MSGEYCIKEGYTSRKEYNQNVQIESSDQFQDEVYQRARQLLDEYKYKKVLDIGCGSSFKLVKYFRDKSFIGLDLEPNLSWLRETYPYFDYMLSDYDNPPKDEFDLVICSDVIEHVLEPDLMIDFINSINFKHLVISTPERDVIQEVQRQMNWDVKKNGPPANICHVREWTKDEFAKYISQTFEIEEHYMTPIQIECQVIVAIKRDSDVNR